MPNVQQKVHHWLENQGAHGLRCDDSESAPGGQWICSLAQDPPQDSPRSSYLCTSPVNDPSPINCWSGYNTCTPGAPSELHSAFSLHTPPLSHPVYSHTPSSSPWPSCGTSVRTTIFHLNQQTNQYTRALTTSLTFSYMH